MMLKNALVQGFTVCASDAKTIMLIYKNFRHVIQLVVMTQSNVYRKH